MNCDKIVFSILGFLLFLAVFYLLIYTFGHKQMIWTYSFGFIVMVLYLILYYFFDSEKEDKVIGVEETKKITLLLYNEMIKNKKLNDTYIIAEEG